MRATLPQGPVLVQVPRAGYLVALVCQECREPMRCELLWRSDQSAGRRVRRGSDCSCFSCAWCGRPQVDWECPICGSRRVRAPIVGAERTAEELGKAFPQTPVRQSIGGRRLADVARQPGHRRGHAWRRAAGRGRLRRRGIAGHGVAAAPPGSASGGGGVTALAQCGRALIRSGADGGSVIAVGESSGRALQALVRVDPGRLRRARAG